MGPARRRWSLPPAETRLARRTGTAFLVLCPAIVLAASPGAAQRAGRSQVAADPASERVIEGTDGADSLEGHSGTDWIHAEAGDDVARGHAGADMLEGQDGNDLLDGGAGDDVIDGGEGEDRLFGGDGDDVMDGGDQDDYLDGGPGRDDLSGGDHDDVILGGADDDTLYGDDNDDILAGGTGDDRLFGGDSADLLRGGLGADLLVGGDGDDVLAGGAGDDRMFGGAGDDIVHGDAGNDTIVGFRGRDFLSGGVEDDRIFGGIEVDTLHGGDGDDLLQGGIGSDRVYGGAGADRLRIRAGDGDADSPEQIDGEAGEDSLVLNGFPAGACADSAESPCSEIVDPETGGRFDVRGIEAVLHEHVTMPLVGGDLEAILINPTERAATVRIELLASDGGVLFTVVDTAEEPDAEIGVAAGARVVVPLAPALVEVSATLRVIATERLLVELRPAAETHRAVGEVALADEVYIPFVDIADATLLVTRGELGGVVKIDHLVGAQEIDNHELLVGPGGHATVALAEIFPDGSQQGAVRVSGGDIAAVLVVEGEAGDRQVTPGIPTPLDHSEGEPGDEAPTISGGPRLMPMFAAEPDEPAGIFVFNPGSDAASGRVEFVDNEGRPLPVEIERRGLATTFPFELPPGGVAFLRTAVRARAQGAIRVTSDVGTLDAVVSWAAGPSRLNQRALRPSRGLAFALPETGGASAVEISLIASEAATLHVELRDTDGALLPGGNRTVELTPRQRLHTTLAELLPDAALERVDGSLIVEAARGAFTATAVMSTTNRTRLLPAVLLR